MLTELNEEEIIILLEKLYTLKACKEIIKLGYEYTENHFPRLTYHDEFGSESLASTLTTVLGTSIGDGEISYIHEAIDQIHSSGGIVPYVEAYDNRETIGTLIRIDNETTRYIYKHNINIDYILNNFIASLNDISLFDYYVNIDSAQVYMNYKQGDGLYIILSHDVFIDSFLDEYIMLLKELQNVQKENEKCQEQ